jgi:hypothetical protein
VNSYAAALLRLQGAWLVSEQYSFVRVGEVRYNLQHHSYVLVGSAFASGAMCKEYKDMPLLKP